MNGFLCLNKPGGVTSFLAVAKARRIVGEKKAGHSGTLDPMATGVLLVAFGKATRFLPLLPDHDKQYRAQFQLGITTDTLDSTGTVLSQADVRVCADQVAAVLPRFTGIIRQVPPMYSALQKDGVRLYTLARQGIEVEREARTVTIHTLALVAADDATHRYTIDVSCSAGTYIRSLIADIGDALGTGAVMTALCRTGACGCGLTNSVTLETLEGLRDSGRLNEAILPTDALLPFDRLTVTAAQARRFGNGGELDLARVRGVTDDGPYRVYAPDGGFLGVGTADLAANILRVTKVFQQQ